MTSTEDYLLYKLEDVFERGILPGYRLVYILYAVTFNSHMAVTNVLGMRNQLRVGSAMWGMKFLARFLFLGLNSVLQCKTKSPH